MRAILRSKIMVFFSFALLAFTIVPLLALCPYNHPSTLDDFLTFQQSKNGPSVLNNVRFGLRFSTTLWHLCWPFRDGVTSASLRAMLITYRAYSVFFIVFFFAAMYFMIRKISNRFLSLTPRIELLLTALFVFSFTNFIGHFAYLFYDIIITSGYTFGLGLFFLFVGFFCDYMRDGKRKVALCILCVLLSGTIEFFPVILGFFLLSYLFVMRAILKRTIPYGFILLMFLWCFLQAIGYTFAPWVGGKIAAYAPNIENPHSLRRFFDWISDFAHYCIESLASFLGIRLFPFILAVSVISLIGAKRKIKSLLWLVGLTLFISVLIISFSLFYSGVVSVRFKYSTVIVMKAFSFLSLLSFLVWCEWLCEKRICAFIDKYDLVGSVIPVGSALHVECSNGNQRRRKVILLSAIAVSFCLILARPELPIRGAWKDLLRSTASNYSNEVGVVYETILSARDPNVCIPEISPIPESLVVDNLWSSEKSRLYQSDIDSAIAPLFSKTSVVVTKRRSDEKN